MFWNNRQTEQSPYTGIDTKKWQYKLTNSINIYWFCRLQHVQPWNRPTQVHFQGFTTDIPTTVDALFVFTSCCMYKKIELLLYWLLFIVYMFIIHWGDAPWKNLTCGRKRKLVLVLRFCNRVRHNPEPTIFEMSGHLHWFRKPTNLDLVSVDHTT